MFGMFKKKPECDKKPVVLLVLDGFGIAPPSEGNAVYMAQTPNYDRYIKEYPHGELIASGESVGLPANEVGNTEVGHLTLGAGRTMDQDLVRIDKSILDETFFTNKALLADADYVRQRQSKLHIMGLVSNGNVHSSMRHLNALIELVKRQGMFAYFHLFLDGRDSSPQDGVQVVGQVHEKLMKQQVGTIASLSGRYYAMDRDRRWERTKLAYEAIVGGKGEMQTDPVEAIKQSYAQDITDEFVKPTVIMSGNQPMATVDDNDAVIFFNFRVDRPKQLAASLIVPHFEGMTNFVFEGTPEEKQFREFDGTFQRNEKSQNLFLVTMTDYQEGMPVSGVAFAPEIVENSFPQILAGYNLEQLRIAESEKERFVTYYFDGLREDRLPGVELQIIPSPKVSTYDKKPEMSVFSLVKAFEQQMEKCRFSFAVLNFANPDMVAHSGSVEATIRAVAHTDKAIGMMEKIVKAYDGLLIVTADHGNAEELLTFPQASFFYTTSEGGVNTEHSNNKVPVIFISNQFEGNGMKLSDGGLADVAPTILTYMGLQVPAGMTGRNLLEDMAHQ